MKKKKTLYTPFKVDAEAAIRREKAPLNKVELKGMVIFKKKMVIIMIGRFENQV